MLKTLFKGYRNFIRPMSFDYWLDVFFDKLENIDKQLSLDELADKFSKNTDNILHTIQKKENIKFGGGVFEIIHKTEQGNKFLVSLKLYFIDKDENYLMKQIDKDLPIFMLTEIAYQELKTLKSISYDVDEPK